jgi:hypothetical protein
MSAEHAHAADRFAREIVRFLTCFCGALAAADGQPVSRPKKGSPRTMPHNANQILAILDTCCHAATFPMLDNGYVYLAASRLSLHRSDSDWALVIEIFGFSPRSSSPDLHIYTFASRLGDSDQDEIGIAQRRERDEHHPIREYVVQFSRNLKREASFADPWRARECHQTHLCAQEHVADLLDLARSPGERGGWARQVGWFRSVGPGGRQPID